MNYKIPAKYKTIFSQYSKIIFLGTYSDVEIIDQYGDVAAKGKAKGKKEPRPDLYVNQPQKPLKELDNSPHSLLHGYSQERIEEARRRVMAKLQKESGKGHKKEHHVDKSHHAGNYKFKFNVLLKICLHIF